VLQLVSEQVGPSGPSGCYNFYVVLIVVCCVEN